MAFKMVSADYSGLMPNSEVLCEPLICVKWHLKISKYNTTGYIPRCTWEEPTLAKIYSLGLFILMIAKTWTGILHGDRRRRVFRTPDQNKLTVLHLIEHLILDIILVGSKFVYYSKYRNFLWFKG